MKRFLLSIALAAIALIAHAAPADPKSEALLLTLRAKYPSTSFTAVHPTPMDGIFEVQMGRNLAYTDDAARHLLFGSMFDMQERTDLTAARRVELGIQQQQQPEHRRAAEPQVDWNSLPLKDAFVRTIGKGDRKMAIFTDPDCPYCKRLEKELTKLDNVTIYTFLYPIDSLHPEATEKAKALWCAGNDKTRSQVWLDFMLTGRMPKAGKSCANPVERNVELAGKLGVRGTPTMISSDGRFMPGAGSAAAVDSFLNGGK